ncbi:mariner Mos1 transposase [Trichonephila clavipes]|nr:mariner Mos1 transposase [Trichonephila clavipes]
MSAYEPNSRLLLEVLIFCFNMKKSAAEAHRMLSNTYGEAAISERTCREWFQRFKNGDFDVEDQHGIWPRASKSLKTSRLTHRYTNKYEYLDGNRLLLFLKAYKDEAVKSGLAISRKNVCCNIAICTNWFALYIESSGDDSLKGFFPSQYSETD